MNSHQTTLGGLSCRVVDALPPEANPELVVILCHGFGAPGTDLVPLVPEILALDPGLEAKIRFVFPAAPLSDEMGMVGGRAWWHLDVQRLAMAVEQGELRILRNEIPEGLESARDSLMTLVMELQRSTGLPVSRFVLGGFSQGAMLATDVALRLDDSPLGLGIFSGTLLCEEQWRELAANRGSLHVFQSHGRFDPLLPFQASEWLRDLFLESGMKVDFVPFDGMHEIPPVALHRFTALLGTLADETP
ncbi:MAG: phospholipase [Planctomycetes bacterium]|nr:phospholipase [Planctomycetota bacterium]